MNILLTLIGFVCHWLIEAAKVKKRTRNQFRWSIFLYQNSLNIAVTALATTALFFAIDIDSNSFADNVNSLGFNPDRLMHFFVGFGCTSIIHRISKLFA